MLIIGDNPFQNISHLSQQRARERGTKLNDPKYAAEVVSAAIANGADGFIFSVSDKNLAILKSLNHDIHSVTPFKMYAITPYVFEFVRAAVLLGGITGLAKKSAMEIIRSYNIKAVASGLSGVVRNDPRALLRAFMSYEIARIRSATQGKQELSSVLVHEVITDMALGMNMDWLFREHIASMKKLGLKPGFDTRNLPLLARRFKEWGIDPDGLLVIAPFNSIGFQMSPSREACEDALNDMPKADVFAFSLLAAGYFKPDQTIEYIKTLSALKGVIFGVSNTLQAENTFSVMRNAL